MSVSFSSKRSDAIRAGLTAHPRLGSARPRILRAVGLVVAGALAGGGVSAAAFAATEARQMIAQPTGQPTPDLGAPVDAPPGVLPGSPIVSLLSTPLIATIAAETVIPLDTVQEAATHARLTVQATSTGSLVFGTDASGNNPSASWDRLTGDGHDAAWYDFPLDESVQALYLEPAGGFTGTVTVQYVNYVPTRLGVNAQGETFGVSGSAEAGEPDLVAVEATNGKTGYAKASDLEGGPMPTSPEDALARQEANKEGNVTIPVYESDGITVIGEFTIG